MKKLLFIDNDSGQLSKDGLRSVQRKLSLWAKLPAKMLEDIAVVEDFWKLSKDEMCELIFSGKHAICTYSMYTYTHFNSLGQLIGLLATAGVSQVKDIVYIDCSGNIKGDLGGAIKDSKNTLAILNAVEANNIISFGDGMATFRLRVEIKGLYESPFKEEKVNLKKLLKF